MKTKIAFLLCMLSAFPFAFYKMKGPYFGYTNLTYPYTNIIDENDFSTIHPINIDKADELFNCDSNGLKQEKFFFNYEPNTRYVLIHDHTSSRSILLTYAKFLKEGKNFNLAGSFGLFNCSLEISSDNSYLEQDSKYRLNKYFFTKNLGFTPLETTPDYCLREIYEQEKLQFEKDVKTSLGFQITRNNGKSYLKRDVKYMLDKYCSTRDIGLFISPELTPSYLLEDIHESKKLQLEKDVKTSLGVQVTHSDGKVYINQEDKKMEIKTALKRYLYDDTILDSINNAVMKRQHGNSEKNEKKYSLFKNSYELKSTADRVNNGLRVDRKQIDLLNNSKILAVYAVFKGKDDKESIIWGLARDIKTGKNFHWMTDLKDDVSVLLK